jgi:vacuolar iron transporter family protein
MVKFSGYSFGATSAIMTGLAVIVGLSSVANYKISIITALLLVAIADNISDSFGIHIQQEAQLRPARETNWVTLNNFITRLIVSSILILFVILLPLALAIAVSIIFSIALLVTLSYLIAKAQKVNPRKAILQHMVIAIIVLAASYALREFIPQLLQKL